MPLNCATDSVEVCQGTDPWVVALDGPTLVALETITVIQGTSPWVVSGTVALDAPTLAALETITVLQGTSPWVVSGTVTSDATFDYAEDSLHVSGDVGAFVLAVRNDDHAVRTNADGDYSPISVNSQGAIFVEQANATVASTPTQIAQDTTADIVIASNADRRGFSVQNTGTTVIKLAFGSTDPTQTAYHVALKACAEADDGTGGYYADDQWSGDVRAISSGASGTLVALEIT